MNRIELVEAHIKEFLQDRYNAARRVINCMETQKDKGPCWDCADKSLCHQIRDVLF